jgi:hypothetical protein
MIRRTLLAAMLTAAPAAAQDFKPLTSPPARAIGGAEIKEQPGFGGFQCAAGCLVVASPDGKGGARLDVARLAGEGGVRLGILLDHGRDHTLRVAANGEEWVSILCNEREVRVTPRFAGARRFSVVRLDGGKEVSRAAGISGTAAGVTLPALRHGTPMEVEVVGGKAPRIVIVHGTSQLVLTPLRERGTPERAPVMIRALELRADGVPAFAVTSVEPLAP